METCVSVLSLNQKMLFLQCRILLCFLMRRAASGASYKHREQQLMLLKVVKGEHASLLWKTLKGAMPYAPSAPEERTEVWRICAAGLGALEMSVLAPS